MENGSFDGVNVEAVSRTSTRVIDLVVNGD